MLRQEVDHLLLQSPLIISPVIWALGSLVCHVVQSDISPRYPPAVCNNGLSARLYLPYSPQLQHLVALLTLIILPFSGCLTTHRYSRLAQMGLPDGTAQLLDAAFASGLEVLFQCIYCLLKFCDVPGRSRLWVLVGLACVFGFIGLTFILIRIKKPIIGLAG